MAFSRDVLMLNPRILTAAEIGLVPRTGIVWIEFFNPEEGEGTFLQPAMKCADGTLVSEDCCVFDNFEQDMKYQEDGYWRFWSAEPTKEIREREKWPHEYC